MVRSALLACTAMLLTSVPVRAQQVISSDLIVQGSACIGTPCPTDISFGYNTLVLQDENPSIQFVDTSSSSSFPRADWSIESTGGVFSISNEDTAILALSAADDSVTLGANSTAVAGAISVGGTGTERRIVHVADGTADTDAATFGQLSAAVTAATTTNQTLLASYDARLGMIEGDITDLQTDVTDINRGLASLGLEMNRVAAMSSAFSALSVNPRGTGDHFFSAGYGRYGGENAVALGSFHFLNDNRIFVNTGVARALGNGGATAFRAGITFGN